MKKIILVVLIAVVLVVSLNTAFAMSDEVPHMDFLITNYRNVESITFIAEDNLGNENEQIYDLLILAQKTKMPLQRIISYFPDYSNITYEESANWEFEILVKMKDGSEYVSEKMEYSRLYDLSDYVFNTRRYEFIDKKIYSRFPTSSNVFLMGILLIIASIAVLGIKSIVGASLKIKPTAKLIASVLLSNFISIILILFCYILVPINIHLSIIGVIVGMGFFEHKYLNYKCSETTLAKRIIYIIASNALVIMGVVYIIVFMFYGEII